MRESRLLRVTVVAATGFPAYAIRHETLVMPSFYWLALAAAALLYLIAEQLVPRIRGAGATQRVLLALGRLLLVAAVMVSLAYAFKVSDSYSRLWSVYWFLSAWVGLLVVEFAPGARAAGRLVLVGNPSEIEQARSRFIREPGREVICLDLAGALAWLEQVNTSGTMKSEDEIVLIGRLPEPSDRTALVLALHGNPVAIRYCPDLHDSMTDVHRSSLPLLLPPGTFEDLVKRAEDLVLGSIALLLCAVPMLVIAGLIRLDGPGPVLFGQRRLGLEGRAFTIYKFRSMVSAAASDAQAEQAMSEDARVTRVGAFLRRWGLDELPQLFNVLKGDMSLVGPRPHAFPHDMQWGMQLPDYAQRFRMRPGITGLAQIHGQRGYAETIDDIRERLDRDLEYIRRWSPLLDLRIMLQTIPALARGALSETGKPPGK